MTTLQDIEKLLAAKKYDEAKKLIHEAGAAHMTDREKGAALAGLARLYMEISNSINTQYRDALKDAIAGMKKLNAAEAKSKEKIDLAEVREKLNG